MNPGQATRRVDKARANRQRMRAAALGLFAEQGYAATSMQAVAAAAGMAVQIENGPRAATGWLRSQCCANRSRASFP